MSEQTSDKGLVHQLSATLTSINNLSRTSASMELKEITADRTSPIGWMGSGSHKVWVKRKE